MCCTVYPCPEFGRCADFDCPGCPFGHNPLPVEAEPEAFVVGRITSPTDDAVILVFGTDVDPALRWTCETCCSDVTYCHDENPWDHLCPVTAFLYDPALGRIPLSIL